MLTLDQYRLAQGFSKRELAKLLGLSASYTHEILNGEKSPSLAVALRIQGATGGEVSLSSLVKSPSTSAPSTEAAE